MSKALGMCTPSPLSPNAALVNCCCMFNSDLARPRRRLEAPPSGVPRSHWNTVKYPEREREKRVPEEARAAGGWSAAQKAKDGHSQPGPCGWEDAGGCGQCALPHELSGLQPHPCVCSSGQKPRALTGPAVCTALARREL